MSRARQDSPTLNPLIVLAGIILVLYFARAVLIPLALALTLNFLLTPVVMWFQKLHMRRIPAVALTMLISVAALGCMGWVVAEQLLQVANDLPKYRLNIDNKIKALHYPTDSALGRATESVKEIGMEFSDQAISPKNPPAVLVPGSSVPGSSLPGSQGRTVTPPAAPAQVQVVTVPPTGLEYLGRVLSPVLRPLGTTGMVLIFTVFILIKQEDLRDRLLRLGGLAQLNAMTLALNDAGRRISRYLVMQVLVNACFGVCFGAGLFLIGVPNATLWGVIAGVLRIVPYVGAVTAATGAGSRGIPWLGTATADRSLVRLARIDHRKCCRALAVRRAHRNLLPRSAGHYRFLDNALGLGGTCFGRSAYSLCDRIGPLCTAHVFPACFIGG
jgi:predicted PurR-regulated permease PerM